MSAVTGGTGTDLTGDKQPDAGQGMPAITCFCCGVCCTKYQPPVTHEEARHLAAGLGISLDEFVDKYVDESWYVTEYFLLDTYREACIFLERAGDEKLASCRIYASRPLACREWVPSLSRKECQEGLTKYWGLTVGSSGQIEGPERKIREFHAFLKSLES